MPHWRLKPGTGISIARMAENPPAFDLVLLVQGSALLPYVEAGPVSDSARWRTLMEPFGRGFMFMRFAIWSN